MKRRKRMKKTIILTLVLMLVSGMVYPRDVVIKFASVAPEGSTWMNIMEDLNETVKEKTKGKVRFKFYAGSVMGDESDVIKKMRINQVNAAGFTSQGLGEIVKEVRVLNIPLILRSSKEADYVLKKMEPYFNKRFREEGYVVLGWPEVGFAYVFSTEKVDSVESFKKLKMWVWGEDVLVNTLFRNIGVVPVPLSIIDVTQALQTGMIEGVYGSPLSALSMQWHTMVRYMLDKKIAYVPGAALITKRTWKRMSDKQRDIVMEESKKDFRKLTKKSRGENEQAMRVMKKQGIKFTEIDDKKDLEFLREVSNKTAADLTGKYYSKELLDEMKGYIKEFREKKSK